MRTMTTINALLQGLAVGLSLIMAIGPQNTFVIQQGIKREHTFLCAIACTGTDALLIMLGVIGLGALFKAHPMLVELARWFGATFLIAYGLIAFKSAMHPQTLSKHLEIQKKTSTKKIVLMVLGFGLLNPHAYLDTVVLIGSISAQYTGANHYIFGLGTIIASAIWFFSLAYGAKILTPLFRKAIAWRVLDIIIGCTMLLIAITLII